MYALGNMQWKNKDYSLMYYLHEKLGSSSSVRVADNKIKIITKLQRKKTTNKVSVLIKELPV